MSADHDVHGPIGEALDRGRLLLRRNEPREEADLQREGGEALAERLVMLRGEDRRRDEDCDLLAVLRGLERGPQRDLGLAVADVADDEPVHRADLFHVGLDLERRPHLVRGLLVWERRLHLGLPRRVGAEGVATGPGTRRIQLEQLLREIRDRPRDPLLGPEPLRAAEAGQGRPLPAGIASDTGDLLDRDEDPVAARERELEVVAVLARAAATQHLLVARHAVVDVDDEVAGRQAFEDVARDDPPQGPRAADADGPEQLAVGDEREPVRAAGEAAVQAAIDERDGPRRWGGLDPLDDPDRLPGLLEQLREARRLVGGQHDAGAVRPPALDGIDHPGRPTEREGGLPPAEEVARRQRSARHRAALGRLGFPRELERSRRHEAALPVARREVRRRPVLGQVAGPHQLGPSLVRLAPEELGGLGDVARLVEHDERARLEVVEARRGRQLGCPDLCGIADRHRPCLAHGQRRSKVVRGALEPVEVRSQAFGEPGGGPAQPVADRRDAARWQQELGRRQEHGLVDDPHGALVGGVEGAQRVDLVAEELDPDRERQRGREDVDDAAPTGELAPTRDLGHRDVAEFQQLPEQCVLMQPGAGPEPAWLGRQVAGRDRVLEEGLDARDHDPSPTAPPGREGGHAGGCLVGHELAALVGEGGPRFECRDCLRVAEPRPKFLRDPVPDLGVPGDPDESLPGPCLGQGSREIGLGAVRHRDETDMPADPSTVLVRPTESLEQRRERAGLDQQLRQGREVRQAMAATRPSVRSGLGPGRPARPLGLGPGSSRLEVLDLSVHLGDVEVDLGRALGRPTQRVACRELLGDLFRDAAVPTAAAAHGWRRRLRHRRPPSAAGPAASPSASCARRRVRAGRRPRQARRGGRRPPVGARTC